jgi:iron complex outermembrane receptor protein
MAKAKYLGLAFAAEWAIAVTLTASVYAQVAGPSPSLNLPGATEQEGPLPQIIVTGYVIPRVGEGPQPVTTLDQDFIAKQGDQTVAEVLQRLPMTAGNFGPTTDTGNSSSPASASVSLHGLPSNFSLVLVDGKRMPSFPFPIAVVISFVDINSIPLAAVDRIEILNDGGTAVYGSDAIAGVVNVITSLPTTTL